MCYCRSVADLITPDVCHFSQDDIDKLFRCLEQAEEIVIQRGSPFEMA